MLPLILRHHLSNFQKTHDSLGLNHHSCFKIKIFPTGFLSPPLLPTTSLEVDGLWFIFLYLVLFDSYIVTSNSRNASIAADCHEAHSHLGHHLQVQSLSLDKISMCLPIAFTHVWPLYTAQNTCSYSVPWQHFKEKANRAFWGHFSRLNMPRCVWFGLYPLGSSNLSKYKCPTVKWSLRGRDSPDWRKEIPFGF